MPNLNSLRLEEISPTQDLIITIGKMPKLKSLVFVKKCEFKSEDLLLLKVCDGRLTRLNFSKGDGLTNDNVRAIVAALPGLTEFRREWCGTSCGEAGLRELAKLSKLSTLGWCHMKDDDCRILASFPNLRDCSIYSSPSLTDNCFEHLLAIPKLNSLGLHSTKNLTLRGIDDFKKARGNVKYYID